MSYRWPQSARGFAAACVLLTSFGGCSDEAPAVAPIPPGASQAPAANAPAVAQPAAAQPAAAQPAAVQPSSVPAAGAIPSVTISDAERATADALVAGMQRGRFETAATRERANALPFLYIAATSSNEAAVAQALRALSGKWTRNASQVEGGRRLVDATFTGVVNARLRDPRPPVVLAAMRASNIVVSGNEPDESTMEILLDIAANHPNHAARYAALNTASRAGGMYYRAHPEAAAPFQSALQGPEPWLISRALSGFPTGDRNAREARAALFTPLLSHTDPGVRGQAIDALARDTRLDNDARAQVVAAATPMLSDPHPYTRSEACNALAAVAHLPSIHAIQALLESDERNTYDIAFTDFEGDQARVHHDGSAWSRVSDSALNAIKRLSRPMTERFEYEINAREMETSLPAAVEAARAWYQRNQANIPRP